MPKHVIECLVRTSPSLAASTIGTKENSAISLDSQIYLPKFKATDFVHGTYQNKDKLE